MGRLTSGGDGSSQSRIEVKPVDIERQNKSVVNERLRIATARDFVRNHTPDCRQTYSIGEQPRRKSVRYIAPV